jgi:RNA polymerase sigma factor (sigma-70 family)
MRHGAFPETSAALLLRLRGDPGDAEAWERFARTYGPRIVQWGLRWGLQDADAQDVTQMVLIQFWRQIRRFEYDPSRRFRGWLRTLVHAAWCDLKQGRRDWHQGMGGSGAFDRLDSIAARDDLAARIEEEYDRDLLRLAMQRVRDRVEPRTWEAFWLLNLEGLSGEEAVARLGMRLGSTFAASSKVRRLIRQEVRWLESDEHEPLSR